MIDRTKIGAALEALAACELREWTHWEWDSNGDIVVKQQAMLHHSDICDRLKGLGLKAIPQGPGMLFTPEVACSAPA